MLGDFARRRQGDLLGLVIFAGRSFLQAPLTPDTELLGEMLERVDIGQLPDGTAIGTALALCLSQLKDLPQPRQRHRAHHRRRQQHRVSPAPFVAAEAARAIGVRIHTIGVSAPDTTGFNDGFIWRQGRTPDRLTSSDERVLRRIAERSGGEYFRATDPEALERIMEKLDPLERQEVTHQRDARLPRALSLAPRARAWLLLAAALALRGGRLRTLPMSFAYPWLLPLGLLAVALATWLLRRAERRAPRRAGGASARWRCLRRSSTLVPPGQARTAAAAPDRRARPWSAGTGPPAAGRARERNWCARGGTSCCCSISRARWE